MTRPGPLVATLCVALMLCMTSFMPLAAVLPALFDAFAIGETEAGWLTGAYFGGYAAAVPVLSAWTDRVDARRVVLLGLAVSALAGFGFAALADGVASALALRTLAGAGLAGIHFPAVKLLADRLEPAAASRGQGFYVSTFSIGGGLSFLAAGAVEPWLGWRAVFAVSGAAATLAFVLVWALVPPRAAPRRPRRGRLLDPRPVLANRAAMRYVVAYFGHLWEMFGFRSWLVVMLGISVALPHNAAFSAWNLPVLAAVTSFASMPASVAVAGLAARRARTAVIAATALASVAVAVVLAASGAAAAPLVYALMLVYALTTYGDTGALAVGLMGAADPAARGVALAVYAAAGFLGGALGPAVVGWVMEAAGGRHEPQAWVAAWLVMGLGSALVAAAMLAGRGASGRV